MEKKSVLRTAGLFMAAMPMKHKALLSEARSKGIATNDPTSMKESYDKAMEMLKILGKGHI